MIRNLKVTSLRLAHEFSLLVSLDARHFFFHLEGEKIVCMVLKFVVLNGVLRRFRGVFSPANLKSWQTLAEISPRLSLFLA